MSTFLIIIQRNHLNKFLPILMCIKTIKKEIKKMPDIISNVDKRKEHVLKKIDQHMLLYIVMG